MLRGRAQCARARTGLDTSDLPLGIDVHDVGHMWKPVQPGMVFTVEPGIYIREEKLGVRLENNIFIGEHENIDLMAHIPIEADEIEALMKR